MAYNSLFKFVNGSIELQHEEARLITEFDVLINASKGKVTEGSRAFKVLAFAWLFCSFDSPYKYDIDQERFDASVKDSKLPSGWYPNEIEQAAIYKFNELEEKRFPELAMLITFKRGLNSTKDTIGIIDQSINQINAEIKEIVKSLETGLGLSLEQKTLLNGQLDALILRAEEKTKMLLGYKKAIPDTLTAIAKLEDNVKKQMSDKAMVRGGGDVGNRENPN